MKRRWTSEYSWTGLWLIFIQGGRSAFSWAQNNFSPNKTAVHLFNTGTTHIAATNVSVYGMGCGWQADEPHPKPKSETDKKRVHWPPAGKIPLKNRLPQKSDDTFPLTWPTHKWMTSTPEQQGMDSSSLAKAAAFVRDFNEGGTTADSSGYYHPPKRSDAFLVARHGVIVSESYWGSTNSGSMHTVESGTKSIGAMLLMHAALKGQLSVETNVSDYFPALKPLSPAAATPPLQLKHLISMAGGLNVTYYKNWTCKHSAEFRNLYPGMLQGPPGAIQSVVRPGILLPPGSDFHYSMPNPILAEGILAQTSQTASFAEYGANKLFPVLGINRSEWRWLGDREGLSQATGCSFHSAKNYLKFAYLMLRKGAWEVDGKLVQLLDTSWVAGASKPTPAEWGPCPYYSHFFWRKPLGRPGFPVPDDAYYMFGGGGQYAVIVPSLDLVVVSLFGGTRASFAPPPDIDTYQGREFFPSPDEEIVQYGSTPIGHWNFTFHEPQPTIKTRSPPGSTDLNHVACEGWPPLSSNSSRRALDLLSGMMQAVVAAIKTDDTINDDPQVTWGNRPLRVSPDITIKVLCNPIAQCQLKSDGMPDASRS